MNLFLKRLSCTALLLMFLISIVGCNDSSNAVEPMETTNNLDTNFSYLDLIDSTRNKAMQQSWSAWETEVYLIDIGVSPKNVEFILSNCSVDWTANALSKIEKLLSSTDSPDRVWAKSWLMEVNGFTEEQSDYAIAHSKFDWKVAATIHSNEYVGESWITPSDLKDDLIFRGFTADESVYAINNCLIDWNDCAKNLVENKLMNAVYTPKELMNYLQNNCEFTYEQAFWGVKNCNVDWIDKIDSYIADLDKYIDYSWCDNCTAIYGVHSKCPICSEQVEIYTAFGYTRNEVVEELEKAEFFDQDIINALSRYDNHFFYDESHYKKVVSGNESSSTQKPPEETTEKMVWVSSSGSKYHNNAGCSNMKNPSQITLSKAKQLGYEPCSRCH